MGEKFQNPAAFRIIFSVALPIVEMFKNVVIDGTVKMSILGPFAERAFLTFLDPLSKERKKAWTPIGTAGDTSFFLSRKNVIASESLIYSTRLKLIFTSMFNWSRVLMPFLSVMSSRRNKAIFSSKSLVVFLPKNCRQSRPGSRLPLTKRGLEKM